jgi:hypothetical protein
MSHRSDGGQRGSTASAHLFRRTGCAQILLPCENDQAKLDPFSRLACSTNLSKILASDRLSGLVGSRPRLLRRGVLELVARDELCICLHTSPFLREPFNYIELCSPCQAKFLTKKPESGRTALRKISKSGQQYLLKPLGFAGDQLLGHAMACSL